VLDLQTDHYFWRATSVSATCRGLRDRLSQICETESLNSDRLSPRSRANVFPSRLRLQFRSGSAWVTGIDSRIRPFTRSMTATCSPVSFPVPPTSAYDHKEICLHDPKAGKGKSSLGTCSYLSSHRQLQNCEQPHRQAYTGRCLVREQSNWKQERSRLRRLSSSRVHRERAVSTMSDPIRTGFLLPGSDNS